MRTRKHPVLVITMCMMLSFVYGALTVKYKIFPFHQLKALKDSTSANASTRSRLAYNDYYYHKKSFFDQHKGQYYDIVFIGDSITDGAEWQDMFPSRKIANRGIGGDRTDGLLNRLEHIYSTAASKAFIMIGVNDFVSGISVTGAFNNYKKIISALTARGIKVYIQSTILVGERKKRLNKKIIALNKRLQKLADQIDTVTYIDLNKGLAADSLLQAKYTRDDLHINGAGYAVWKDIIKTYVQ